MDEFLMKYIGTIPQWGVFLVLLIVAVRTSPQWLETWAKMRLARSNRNASRISELEQTITRIYADCEEKIRKCREDCDRETGVLRDEVRDMEDTINGLRRQHVQEQISLINTIIQSVDAPELKVFLKSLESVQRTLSSPIKGTDDA